MNQTEEGGKVLKLLNSSLRGCRRVIRLGILGNLVDLSLRIGISATSEASRGAERRVRIV